MRPYEYMEAVVYDGWVWSITGIFIRTMELTNRHGVRVRVPLDLRLIRPKDEVLWKGHIYTVAYLNESFNTVHLSIDESRTFKRVKPDEVMLYVGMHNEGFVGLLNKR